MEQTMNGSDAQRLPFSLPMRTAFEQQGEDELGAFIGLRLLVPVGLLLWAAIIWAAFRLFS
ncbi:MAG TPA: hypothetical protein VIL01_04680 [Thermomicrobiales bacterium]